MRIALSAAAVALILSVIFLTAPRLAAQGLQRVSPGVIYFAETDDAKIALTIDDAPSAAETRVILDVLEKHAVKATFFIIGEAAEAYPEIVEDIRRQGHGLANHGWSATPSIILNPPRFETELDGTQALFRPDDPSWFRPANALFSPSVARSVNERDMRIVLADVFPQDTVIPSAAFSAWYLRQHVEAGSIIALHDSADGTGRGLRTAKTLDAVIPDLKEKGFVFVTLDDLID